jgi:Uma2 family endonuclease
MVSGRPDLVVEVLSPSNRHDDLHDKRPIYRAAGVGEIWFVDPELQQVLVDRRRAEGYAEEIITTGRVSSHVVAGFWLHTAWLWAKPLPNRFLCLQEILR